MELGDMVGSKPAAERRGGSNPLGGTTGPWRNSIRARLRSEILRVQLPPGPPNIHAVVAELEYAPVSEAGGLNTRGGSTPLDRTKPASSNGRTPGLHPGDEGPIPSAGTNYSQPWRNGRRVRLRGGWGNPWRFESSRLHQSSGA